MSFESVDTQHMRRIAKSFKKKVGAITLLAVSLEIGAGCQPTHSAPQSAPLTAIPKERFQPIDVHIQPNPNPGATITAGMVLGSVEGVPQGELNTYDELVPYANELTKASPALSRAGGAVPQPGVTVRLDVPVASEFDGEATVYDLGTTVYFLDNISAASLNAALHDTNG
jgi:hypothetical protein